MSHDRATMLFFELFSGLPRQGPGDTASTLRALALVPGVQPDTRILDIGCGTGAQTIVLAQHSPAKIVAVDNHRPFLAELLRRAEACGIAGHIDVREADMRELRFPHGSFDVIWCEGAIYVVGFEAGLQRWRTLLAPGGYLALTEVCWTRPDAPEECRNFWEQEYPSIRDVPALLRLIDSSGYDLAGHFTLPPSAWWSDYYLPLEHNLGAFRTAHAGEADALHLADAVQREIDVFRQYSQYYSYEFFVVQVRGGSDARV